MKNKLILLLLCACAFCTVYAQESVAEAEPYTAEEFPEWALTARRAEIVTLGSLPFTTLCVGFAYSAFQYAQGSSSAFPNPFDTGSNYTTAQIQQVLGISLSISAVIGIVDLIISLVHKKNEQNRAYYEEERNRGGIQIVPVISVEEP